jgi:hypothetical protein
MRMVRALAVALVLIGIVLPGAAAAATAPPKPGTRFPGTWPAMGDGHRWIAWDPADGFVHAYDARTGELAEHALPAGCHLGAIGGGQGLVICGVWAPAAAPQLMTLADGTLHEPANAAAMTPTTAGTFNFVAVGRHGLLGYAYGPHRPPPVLWNWRTGERVKRPTYHDIIDLDRPEIVRPMCAPLVRGLNDRSYYDPPWLATGGIHRTFLMHCGRAHSEKLRRIGLAGLHEGLLIYGARDGSHLFTRVRDLRTGRRWSFRGYAFVAQAGRTLVLNRPHDKETRLVRLPR